MEYIPAKTILSGWRPGSGWFGINYNLNLYRGCCHGCIYCDSRSDCYGNDRFDTVRAKENALFLLRGELRRKVKTGIVGTGAMSDPYNPFERDLMLTRHALELLAAYGFGAAIATKSELIERDIDVLQEIAQAAPVLCKVTVTTADDALCRKIEPHVSVSSRRLEAVARLSQAGIFTGLLMMPVLPFLEDSPENILGIVRRAKEAGARFIYPALGMTLRQNQRDWYFEKLETLFPGENLAERYRRRYGNSYECRCPGLPALWKLFSEECDRLGILYQMKDIVRASRAGYAAEQISLF